MSQQFLDTSIEFLKGVGPARANTLKQELGIFTYENLLYYFPFRYVDKTQFHTISQIQSDVMNVQLKGRIVRLEEVGRPRQKRLVATFEDETGEIQLVWFKGGQWIKPTLQQEKEFIVFGKPSRFKGKWSINHPEVEAADSARVQMGGRLKPVYGTTEALTKRGLNSNGIEKIVRQVLSEAEGKIDEFIPGLVRDQLKLLPRGEALLNAHLPGSVEVLQAARNRLKFEELFLVQLTLIQNKAEQTTKIQGAMMSEVGSLFNQFYSEVLPWELTGAQKRVLREIRMDMKHGAHMNRLLQGDVGSGKTIVAILSTLLAIDNGYQACVMAPTEILAQQHFKTIDGFLRDTGVEVRLLTGSTKTAQRKIVHERLASGDLHILVGTHALLEPVVKFKNLGLAIIDEQHRFGVKQRARLWRKAEIPPHVLVMTATPIPRTLAMTMYGDLDVSIIDELPPGRKPITTVHRTDSSREEVFGFIEKEIGKGRQIYIVYPLIEESSAMDYKDLMDGYEAVSRRFPLPKFKISIVHGRMKPDDKNYEMEQFVAGNTQIMVSTTVIEVGVNVPNASVMVIESAERFGLSQLHQLRGRVGRGAEQSYCILLTGNKMSNDARTRMETMVRTNDGFEVSEVDLQLRGPGDIMGTQQSGVLDLKIADLGKDRKILESARYFAELIIEADSELEGETNVALGRRLDRVMRDKKGWGMIS